VLWIALILAVIAIILGGLAYSKKPKA
jgi:hypothetical protein